MKKLFTPRIRILLRCLQRGLLCSLSGIRRNKEPIRYICRTIFCVNASEY